MKLKTFLCLIIAIMSLSGLFKLLSCKGSIGNKVETIEYPPFTIKRKNTYRKRYDINTNRRVDNSRSYYSVYYHDELIEFPKALNENSGVAGLWKAYILKDASRPAILAASQSVYLITEKDQKKALTPISEQQSSFASLLWLDSNNGQPGPKQEIYSTDDTALSCELTGGQFLLMNKNVVLSLNDLSIYPFEFRPDFADNYSANAAIAFSPDKDKIVFMGSKYESEYYYALLVYNFKNNQIQTIPFDRNETRLHEPHDLQPGWFNNYFKWSIDENGSYYLVKIKHDLLPNWQGHFTKEKNYSISPVKKEMHYTFAAFIKSHLNLSDEQIKLEKFGSSEKYNINLGKNRFGISFFDNLQSVYLSIDLLDEDEKGSLEIIKQIGMAFNEQLKSGAHQTLFTAY